MRPDSRNRLRGGDRLAGIGLAHRGDLVVEGLQRFKEFRLALLVIRLMRRVDGE